MLSLMDVAISPDPESIRQLTKSYRGLRGYQQLPFAVSLVVLTALQQLGWARQGNLTVSIGLFLLAVVIYGLIGKYYDHRFGVVQLAGSPNAASAGSFIGLFAVSLVLQMLGFALGLPFQLGFLSGGLALCAWSLRRLAVEAPTMLMGAFLVVVAFWPPVRTPQDDNPLWMAVFGFGFGAIWIVTSVWDHHVLVRRFAAARLQARS
jgi:hypothetical protein